MWINAEDGQLFNFHHLQKIHARSDATGWVIEAQLHSNSQPELVILATCKSEVEAKSVMRTLKSRLENVVEMTSLMHQASSGVR